MATNRHLKAGLWLAAGTLALWAAAAPSCRAAAEATPAPVPTPVATPAPGAPTSATPVGSREAATTPADGAQLKAISEISSMTIKASQDVVEQTKWIFTVLSVLLTGLLAVLAFLGFQNIRNVADSVRDEARRRVDTEITELHRIISLWTQIAVRTQAALRLGSIADKLPPTDANRQSYLQRAIAAVRDVRLAAESLDDRATVTWTYSFEAYCLRGLRQYANAIAVQIIAMQMSEIDDPMDHYNAACFYALAGNAESAVVQLGLAIQSGGERYKTYAKSDLDFALIRNVAEVIALVGPPEPGSAVDAPEKGAPPLPEKRA